MISQNTDAGKEFQSTPLREGRLPYAVYFLAEFRFQSTPLREGRLAPGICAQGDNDVSIHAPARGATCL